MFSHLLQSKLIHLFFAAVLAGDLIVGTKLLDKVQAQYGSMAVRRLNSWQTLMQESKMLSEVEKLNEVNTFFNQLNFVSDISHWGVSDFWATPIEFLASGGGDCEDYSIAKYFTLREMGVDDTKLRITYVKAVALNQAHMVLSYFAKPGQEPVILDNLIADIKPASSRTDLVPVYNFNGDGLWLSRQRGEGKRVGESSRLSKWSNMRERLTQSTGKGQPIKSPERKSERKQP